MRPGPLLAIVIPALAAGALAAPPTLTRSIALPGVEGRIDHLAYDPASSRLFIAALGNGSVEAVDLTRGERTQSARGLDEPQGIAFVPATGQVIVACGGDGTVRALDGATLAEQRRADLGSDADNVRLDADGKTAVVGYGDGAIAALDATTLERTADVKLPGHPESFQLEPSTGRVFVNVPGGFIGGGGAVIVADRAAQSIAATWNLADAGRNFPMALDAEHRRLYVGCRRPARLLVIDTDSGKVLASPECVGDADDVFVDAKTGQVLVIGGDGAIDVFEPEGGGACTRTASVPTAPGARTGLFVPDRRALYVAVPARAGKPAEIREFTLPD